jgi:hypothetical protein
MTSVFFLVVYLASGDISTTVSSGLNNSINAVNETMDHNTNVIAAEVFDIEGNCVYSIGE